MSDSPTPSVPVVDDPEDPAFLAASAALLAEEKDANSPLPKGYEGVPGARRAPMVPRETRRPGKSDSSRPARQPRGNPATPNLGSVEVPVAQTGAAPVLTQPETGASAPDQAAAAPAAAVALDPAVSGWTQPASVPPVSSPPHAQTQPASTPVAAMSIVIGAPSTEHIAAMAELDRLSQEMRSSNERLKALLLPIPSNNP